MFIVNNSENNLRLMSFKSNPWLNLDSDSQEDKTLNRDERSKHVSDISKKDLFMFTSCIESIVPGLVNKLPKKSPAWVEHYKKFGRQYYSDKIQ